MAGVVVAAAATVLVVAVSSVEEKMVHNESASGTIAAEGVVEVDVPVVDAAATCTANDTLLPVVEVVVLVLTLVFLLSLPLFELILLASRLLLLFCIRLWTKSVY